MGVTPADEFKDEDRKRRKERLSTDEGETLIQEIEDGLADGKRTFRFTKFDANGPLLADAIREYEDNGWTVTGRNFCGLIVELYFSET